jgi:hypothetical protein
MKVVPSLLRQTEEAREAQTVPLNAAESMLNEALKEVERCRELIRPITDCIAALDFDLLIYRWMPGLLIGTPIVVREGEVRRLREIFDILDVKVEECPIVLSTRLSSRYSVSKDCGVDDVGWDELGDFDEDTWSLGNGGLVESSGIEFDECIFSSSLHRLETSDLKYNVCDIYFDGDHHGVYAYVKADYAATMVWYTPRELYLHFTTTMPVLSLGFTNELVNDSDVDVSFLIKGKPPIAYDGVSLPLHGGSPRFAREEDLDASNQFWSWAELAREYSDRKRGYAALSV